MDQYDVKRLALVLAVQAEIEGMKMDNLVNIEAGGLPKYTSDHFNEKANRLSDFAYAHNEQL